MDVRISSKTVPTVGIYEENDVLLIFLQWHYLVQAYFLASRGRRLKKIMYLRALLTDIFPRKIVTLHPLFLLTHLILGIACAISIRINWKWRSFMIILEQ